MMGSISRNIGNMLDKQFENSNYLPQKLELEDFDASIIEYIESLGISELAQNGQMIRVPVHFLQKELFAERKSMWRDMKNERGEEISKPFMAIVRTGVVQGTSPLKRTIPPKRKFVYVKVPKFDGTLKGYDLYKIPQPAYVDIKYELRFISSYQVDVNVFYQEILRKGYSDGQGYMNINGYQIRSKIDDPSEDNQTDLYDERVFQVKIPITVFGKFVDPKEFEKMPAVNRVIIKISEKRD